MFPYLLLTLASLLVVSSVALAYEVGKRVGAYEVRRNYRIVKHNGRNRNV